MCYYRNVDIRSIAGQQKVKFETGLDAINLGTLLDGYCALDSARGYKSILQVWRLEVV